MSQESEDMQPQNQELRLKTMEMPLFPLKNVVLFPGMMLPLHIFELRYREMINRCIEEKIPFGVLLIEEGQEVGDTAKPHMVGTAARITRVERYEDGRMDIVALGTQRFRVVDFDHSKSYLSGSVRHFPVINGETVQASQLVQVVRPKIIEYVEMLAKASQTRLKLDRLPEDATTLAFLVAISLQISPKDKQSVLELTGIPEILSREVHLLSREILFTKHMIDTQEEVLQMNMGPTGYIFPN
jgi:Lon protease-like protein